MYSKLEQLHEHDDIYLVLLEFVVGVEIVMEVF